MANDRNKPNENWLQNIEKSIVFGSSHQVIQFPWHLGRMAQFILPRDENGRNFGGPLDACAKESWNQLFWWLIFLNPEL